MGSLPDPKGFSGFQPKERKLKKETILGHDRLIQEWGRFLKLTWRKQSHAQELEAIAPKSVFESADADSIEEFQAMTRYDPRNRTLVLRIDDPATGEIASYRWRRAKRESGIVKWAVRSGTSPRTISRIIDDESPVFVVEGSHDALTAVLCGISFIGIPSSEYKKFTPFEINLLHRSQVFFIPDPDKAGIECMRVLADQAAKEAGASCRIINLAKVFPEYQGAEKLDFSEWIKHRGINVVKNW